MKQYSVTYSCDTESGVALDACGASQHSHRDGHACCTEHHQRATPEPFDGEDRDPTSHELDTESQ
jgi:hypothetical protein